MRLIGIVILCSCLISTSVQAETVSHRWKTVDGNLYYINQQGKPKHGKFYDEKGEIYDTGNSADGRVIRSAKNAEGEFFDENGRLVYEGSEQISRYKGMAKDYESGNTITFKNLKDATGFVEYYETRYSLYFPRSKFVINTTKWTTKLEEVGYVRKAVVDKINQKFGSLKGKDEYEKIKNACQLVSDRLNYNLAYARQSMEVCLDNNVGVCWTYTKAASTLLDEAGIYNEILVGKYKGIQDYHMWLRCKVNGVWVYVDPTMYESKGSFYDDIDYQFYIENYDVIDLVNIS